MFHRLILAVALFLGMAAQCPGAESSTRPATMPIGILRERMVRSVLPSTAQQLQSLDFVAQRFANQLNADGAWPDIDYSDASPTRWKAAEHLERLLTLAKAYRASIDAARPDRNLKSKIALALDRWLAKDPQNPNWWWNQIGAPQMLGETMIIFMPDATDDQIARSIAILARSKWNKWTGQNLVWGVQNEVYRGILASDAGAISAAYTRLNQELVTTRPEGIQPDFSFHQHGPQLYNGGYGLAFANDVGRLIAFAWDTPWQPPPDKMDIYTSYMLDAQAWMIWERTFDYSAVGREIVRPGKSALPSNWLAGPVSPAGAAYSLANTVYLLSQHPLPRAQEWKAFLSRLRREPRSIPLFGNKHFWCSDYMTHRRLTWFSTVKMLSDRMFNAELVNDEGKLSHHLSEGANFIYCTGDEYRDIFPVWDWRKIPGTTAEQSDLAPDPRQIHFKGATTFVGGVSDGTYGLAFMDLRRDSLVGHKAWFFFDNEFVCLGAGINCSSDSDVFTTVNQSLLRGPINQGFNPARRWVHHDGIGYIFPQHPNPADKNPLAPPPSITVLAQRRTGAWSNISPGPSELCAARVFTIGIDHGPRPINASYACIVLPDTAADEVAERTRKLEIDILANNSDLQCVYHRGLDILMAAFFKPGKIGNVSVDQPCLLILRNGKLTLSNPNNQPLVINVNVGNVARRITLPDAPAAGSSITIDTALP